MIVGVPLISLIKYNLGSICRCTQNLLQCNMKHNVSVRGVKIIFIVKIVRLLQLIKYVLNQQFGSYVMPPSMRGVP